VQWNGLFCLFYVRVCSALIRATRDPFLSGAADDSGSSGSSDEEDDDDEEEEDSSDSDSDGAAVGPPGQR
jgi:hypothetical protein